MNTPVETLCRGFPDELMVYLNYCKGLRFEEKPDYGYLKRLFKELFFRESYECDFIYDWVLKKQEKKTEEEKKKSRNNR